MSRSTSNLRRVAIVAVLVPLGACATKRDLRDLQTEMRAMAMRQDSALQVLNQSFLRANRETQDSVRAFSELVFQFRGDVNNQLLAMQDQLLRIGELTGQGQRSLAALRGQLNSQRRQASQSPPPPPAGRTQEQPRDEEVVQSVPGTENAPVELYNSAVGQLNRGNFTVAAMGFRRFLEEYPTDVLAPAAHIHLGELLSQENRLEEAAEEYLKVRELFPTSEQVPDALFRAGVIYLEMEDFSQARQYLEQVINSYGDHAVAVLAEERLRDIP